MRKSDREKYLATSQAIGLILIVGLLTGLAAWNDRRPADATQLSLPISDLRSQSAELANLRHEYTTGDIDDRFLRAHTLQLLKQHDDTRQELDDLDPWPELRGIKSAALADATLLRQQLEATASGSDLDERDVEVLRDRFRGRERPLRD